jgi:predicted RNA-binding protein with RPS1 domain
MSDEPPAISSIHKGVVHTVKPFGVFVSTEGYRRHVLVHHSQV